ncbi:IS607 family transposase [Bifidobacterium gallicum]|uniref:GNAT family acetyltransferase n=2 Tax=Bifidobacterium gallicum TaxID=78342 RepID=D1NTK3_9BIFI|nr:IS607 family transposase [Bifidobacterium gallicum]EFA23057.1 resolvase, N-terminal domain protein [Bifidobacterium gallicum DSM 20093 = LMG 11596]KFI57641.1 GNAT family acetyltransferase [Bifidobacterium gallicum DSM 20093 = LMG 11596]
MNLSEYARKHGIQYRAAWNRYKAGKIKGAYQDEVGHIIIPDPEENMLMDAAVYSRVSDGSKRHTRLPAQQERVERWAVKNGYRVAVSVAEVGSGVNDKRRKLTALLKRDDWGTLIVEHKGRLTRFGFNWFRLFLEQRGRRIVVVNENDNDRADLVADLIAIIYSFCARLYGQRRSEHAKKMTRVVEQAEAERNGEVNHE